MTSQRRWQYSTTQQAHGTKELPALTLLGQIIIVAFFIGRRQYFAILQLLTFNLANAATDFPKTNKFINFKHSTKMSLNYTIGF